MPTIRETVLAALHTRLQPLAALVLRDEVLPERIPTAGLIILRDSQPGEPEVTLPPLRYHYQLDALGTNPYWARNWLLFGQETKPVTGAVLIFERGSGGHVGFAVGQDDTHFYVLGGNQSDAVTIARIAKPRLLGARWRATYPPRPQRLPTMKPGEFLATTNEI